MRFRIADFGMRIEKTHAVRVLQSAFRIPHSEIILLLLLTCVGCSSSPQLGAWSGPQEPVLLSTQSWENEVPNGRRIRTGHYDIFTTIQDDSFIGNLAQVMEGALQQYRKLAPEIPVSSKSMQCFIFANRAEWADFTKKHAGADAEIYLKINRGGYSLKDWYVSYYLGDLHTYAVASHEGWHQYVARHFKGRIPPFLEEGIACMFEGVSLTGGSQGLPRWNWAINLHRAKSLRSAMQHNAIWPLEQLIQMHAGEIVDDRPERIEAFYAQDWAFARFLWEADGGKYRAGFQRLLEDAASGEPPLEKAWRPRTMKGALEKYLRMPLPEIEAQYMKFAHRIAFEDFSMQWEGGN